MTSQLTDPTVDPVTLEVLRGRLDMVADEMEMTLLKSSYSTIVTEGLDATASVFDAQGRTIAQAVGIPGHLGILDSCALLVAKTYPAGVAQEGDLYIMNDPYQGGAHLPDVTLVAPVFSDGVLIGYVACTTHHQDIGGAAPASTAPDAVDLHAEGLLLPLLKLRDRGVLNETLLAILSANVRLPAATRGDLDGQIAACETGARRLQETYRQFGAEQYDRFVDALLDYAERLTRNVIQEIPDGTYEFHDYLDDDGLNTTHIKIQVTITVSGSDIHFDFSGTDPQVEGAINCTPESTLPAVYFGIKALASGSLPNNAGCHRPVTVHLPKGSIVNCEYPSPVGCRAITYKRIADVVMGALSRAVPDRVYAGCSGQANMMYVGGIDPVTNERFINYVGVPTAGGMGARPSKDGVDVTDTDLSNIFMCPVEVTEALLPMRVKSLRLWTDSGGAGRWRGGLGYEAEFEWLRGESWLMIRRDGHVRRPFGLDGGLQAPQCSTSLRRKGSEEIEPLPSKKLLKIRHGDTLLIQTSGGGGYGDPLLREPERVLEDVLDRRVSREAAQDAYGVVLTGGEVDLEATRARRAELASARQAAS